MNLLTGKGLVVQFVWILLALAGALIIMAVVLGDAAWNGVNFVMALYLLFSLGGFLGLVVALITSSSKRPLFVWMAGLSSLAITCEALSFALGFIYGRNPRVLLNEKVGMFGIRGPLLAFYGFSIVSCSVQVLRSIFKYRQLRVLR